MSNYNIIVKIPMVTFIKGDTIDDLIFCLYNKGDADPVSLTVIEPRMYLFPIGYSDMLEIFDGKDYKVGNKDSTNANEFSFNFTSEETANLRYEKYQYYIVLHYINKDNSDIKRIEGEILFKN